MSTHPATPPESEMVEALLDVLRQSHAPRTAAQLRDGLPGPKLPTAARLGAILEGQVAAGAVARFDPLSGKTPRYWTPGRDEHAGLRTMTMDALRAADGPRTAAEIRKALPDATAKAPALTRLLEEQVAAEAAVRFDPVKGTAARYWTPGREEHGGVVEELLAALRAADGPKTAAELLPAMPGAGIKAPQLEPILVAQAKAKVIHRHEPKTAKGKPRYWVHGPEYLTREAPLEALAKAEAADQPLNFTQFHQALKGTTKDQASEILQNLLDAGEAHKALDFNPGKKPNPRYVTRPPDLRAYLEADLAAIYARYEKAGVSREQFDAAARAYLGAPAAAPVPAPTPVGEAPTQAPDARNLATAVLEVFEELRREKFGHTGLVPIHEIRREIARRLGPEAARHDVLDGPIKEFHRGDRLRLLPINDASGVSAEEMNASIHGNNVTWFYLEAKS